MSTRYQDFTKISDVAFGVGHFDSFYRKDAERKGFFSVSRGVLCALAVQLSPPIVQPTHLTGPVLRFRLRKKSVQGRDKIG